MGAGSAVGTVHLLDGLAGWGWSGGLDEGGRTPIFALDSVAVFRR